MTSHPAKPERAVLIGLVTRELSEDVVNEYLDELTLLATTAGAVTLRRFIQKSDAPDATTFIGKGKIEEISGYIAINGADIAIFDDELSGSQIRNIEKSFRCKVIDRTNLILDIFAKRAQTAHARIQVELAQYQYLLPRLAGMWEHLERQKGGIGLRGPGEREIETDRRRIRKKISILKEKLEAIDRQKSTQRQHRGKMVRLALVGYTNAGKSTLMNVLSKTNLFAEDKLFATLDTTVRKMVIGNLPVLISDTVGFIRKLPHHLIESFKSTLDELRESDILLHVVDISHPAYEDQIRVVNETLEELGSAGKPLILVYNKMDAFKKQDEHDDTQSEFPRTRRDSFLGGQMPLNMEESVTKTCKVYISALQKTNIEELRHIIYKKARELHVQRYPYDDFLYPDIPETPT